MMRPVMLAWGCLLEVALDRGYCPSLTTAAKAFVGRTLMMNREGRRQHTWQWARGVIEPALLLSDPDFLNAVRSSLAEQGVIRAVAMLDTRRFTTASAD